MKAVYGGETGITITTPLSKNGALGVDRIPIIDGGGGDIFNISRRNMHHVVDGVENLPKNSRKSPAALTEVRDRCCAIICTVVLLLLPSLLHSSPLDLWHESLLAVVVVVVIVVVVADSHVS